jgi:hypothetical protein
MSPTLKNKPHTTYSAGGDSHRYEIPLFWTNSVLIRYLSVSIARALLGVQASALSPDKLILLSLYSPFFPLDITFNSEG